MDMGSVWRKWDLHVHTPASFQRDFEFTDDDREVYGDDIWEKYVTELERITDVSVIGITDYFSIEGYKKITEYRRTGRLRNFDLILPNIEFRLGTLVGDRRLNYHVIFADDLDPDAIEREFLGELHLKDDRGEQRVLNRENLEQLGQRLRISTRRSGSTLTTPSDVRMPRSL